MERLSSKWEKSQVQTTITAVIVTVIVQLSILLLTNIKQTLLVSTIWADENKFIIHLMELKILGEIIKFRK